jgi:hypothetical protein
MITVAGSIHRSFTFPAELPIAYCYFSDLGRVLSYLPHILLVREYGYDQFRMLYSTTELGVYHIRIFCDLTARLDEKERALYVDPMNSARPVKARAGVKSATAQGYYSSTSLFREAGAETLIEYDLQLWSELPTPMGLRLMPATVVNRVAQSITKWRIREIAEGFIERSIDAFPHWLAEMEQTGFPC